MKEAENILTAGGDAKVKELLHRLIEKLKAEGLTDSKILEIISYITE